MNRPPPPSTPNRTSQPAASLRAGDMFAGDYRVEQPLASGGMGAVYVARQLSTGRQRALKIMLGGLADSADLKRRFVQEARIGSEIDSKHIVEVVGAGIDAETQTPWLAMELLQGEDLAQLLQREGRLSVGLVLEVFEQLAHALAAAHDKQIVHRDLKPENLFLAQERRAGLSWTVKVLDFGIAKLMNQARTSMTGAMGTPLWMAPEQAHAGSEISPATDVWAMGLIAFRALAGKPFWRAAGDANSSSMMVLREVVMEPIPPASARARELDCPPLPAGFDEWFAGCVERDSARRFQHARQAFQKLRLVLTDSPVAVSALTQLPATHPPHNPTIAARPLTAAVQPPYIAASTVVPVAIPALPHSRAQINTTRVDLMVGAGALALLSVVGLVVALDDTPAKTTDNAARPASTVVLSSAPERLNQPMSAPTSVPQQEPSPESSASADVVKRPAVVRSSAPAAAPAPRVCLKLNAFDARQCDVWKR